MATVPNIRIVDSGSGWMATEVTPEAFDAAMARYLPASPADLRTLCEARAGADYSHIKNVCQFIGILADWDYNTDGSPFSIDNR